MHLRPGYPTSEHVVGFFTETYAVDAVLLVNSCA